MSEANVEVVRRYVAMLNARDVEGLRANSLPDVVFDRTRSIGPDAEVFEGADTVQAFIESWLRIFPDWSWEVTELVPAGDHVVIVGRAGGTGGESGVPVEGNMAQVATVQDGRIARMVLFQTREDALRSIGLEP